ncbi:hypothetical protein [Streptomyces caniscabiei]|uniref:Uncharacterized protein n=1 Tax=Streptomyces caniscabiei TaxID=2746961 RepID=A0ABU4N250_9ACTN|nr:hypothetical protein [Streptomyces caniscabiei]MBE4790268.1 hypothetical protein [Streptomyces caniscabiei]MBE4799503.1 hypothetical protein [Streptomyces caniscabiei]MDX3015125.1 hypothetical protein [Streptomyces caniscabiei]MDX3042568.1 hypothetical protein [Streptomyces caniscabiei]
MAETANQAAEEQEPTLLRWGLNDVMYGDDDTTTVMLSGPDGEPYWLELEPGPAAVLRDDLAGPDTAFTEQLERGRQQLLEAMSGVSEERWCAGWLEGLDRRLHEEGGIWEILGRAVGWPTGSYKQRVWLSWDEAAALYAEETQPADRPPE